MNYYKNQNLLSIIDWSLIAVLLVMDEILMKNSLANTKLKSNNRFLTNNLLLVMEV